MTGNYEQLYENKCHQYQELETEYNEYKDASKQLEDEFENQIEQLFKKSSLYELQLQQKNEELFNLKKYYEGKLDQDDHQKQQLENQIQQMQEIVSKIQENKVMAENENEDLKVKQRISENYIKDLEEKMDASLEELIILQTELENNKTNSQEQIQRLKQQLKETEIEIQAIHLRNQKALENVNSKQKQYLYKTCSLIPKEFHLAYESPFQNKLCLSNSTFERQNTNKRSNLSQAKPIEEFIVDEEQQNSSLQETTASENKGKDQETNGFESAMNMVNSLIDQLDQKIGKIRGIRQSNQKFRSNKRG